MKQSQVFKCNVCEVTVFLVSPILKSGDVLKADSFRPLSSDWNNPVDGDYMTCPNCGASMDMASEKNYHLADILAVIKESEVITDSDFMP